MKVRWQMANITNELADICNNESGSAQAMAAFDEINSIYLEGLAAMGIACEDEGEVVLNSATVVIAIGASCLSSGFIQG
jgi:hypothetical protein